MVKHQAHTVHRVKSVFTFISLVYAQNSYMDMCTKGKVTIRILPSATLTAKQYI